MILKGFRVAFRKIAVLFDRVYPAKKLFENQNIFLKGVDRMIVRVYIADKYFEYQNI